MGLAINTFCPITLLSCKVKNVPRGCTLQVDIWKKADIKI